MECSAWTICQAGHFYQPFVWDNMVFDKDNWTAGGAQYAQLARWRRQRKRGYSV